MAADATGGQSNPRGHHRCGGRVRLLGGAAAGPPDRCFATLEEQPGGRPTPGRGAAGLGLGRSGHLWLLGAWAVYFALKMSGYGMLWINIESIMVYCSCESCLLNLKVLFF
ncbi:unnamed protein product [Cladocopium goreaui]|uniref:Uncharacterized protein n=1 Tax=Cladocopium goreaui TaxID=2562237 RepID=A0A9P1D484_9DINO|nr:unnamed protein product [Cladocopium goreaui]